MNEINKKELDKWITCTGSGNGKRLTKLEIKVKKERMQELQDKIDQIKPVAKEIIEEELTRIWEKEGVL